MFARAVLLGLGLVTAAVGQQTSVAGSITAQLGSGSLPGTEITDALPSPYVYSEHLLDLTAGFGPLTLWANLEFSSPPQIGPRFNGLRKLRLWWEGDRLGLSAGDLQGQFGRGLALNMWENQDIDWDSSLRGVWLTVRPFERLSAALVYGSAGGGQHLLPGPGVDARIRDFTDDASVTALQVAVHDLAGGLELGAYWVGVQAMNPWFSKLRDFSTGKYLLVDEAKIRTASSMPGLFAEWVGSVFNASAELTVRDHSIADVDSLFSQALNRWVHYERQSRGWGGYGSLSLYPGRWGLTLEYKNYLFDASEPDVRSHLPFRLQRRTPVQNPPSVFREHSATLLARTPHVMDFEDEVGVQLEGHLALGDDLFLIANYARSSRHTGFSKVIRHDGASWQRTDASNLFWFSRRERYYPFREFYGEVNYHYSPLNLDLKGMVSVASEVLGYAETVVENSELAGHAKEILHWEQRKLLTLPLQASLSLPGPGGWGLTLDWEHQWEQLGFRNRTRFRASATALIDSVTSDGLLNQSFYYRYLALSIGRPSRFTLGIVYDYASRLKTGRSENVLPAEDSWLEAVIRSLGVDLRNKWFGLEFTGYLTPSTSLSVFYGSLQGGLKCDSGVCVFVPGIADALKLTFRGIF